MTPEGRARLFWAKVQKRRGCWVWTAHCDERGYGRFCNNGKSVGAHRYSYELHNGPLTPGLEVDHTCFNHACVNPRHLQAATRQQNAENLPHSRRNNTSGRRGISWSASKNRWRGQVVHDGRVYARHFAERADAERWVVAKRNELYSNNLIDRRAS